MRPSFDTLTTALNYFGGCKVLFSSESTHRPKIFVRSRSARLPAAKNETRLRKRRSTADEAANSANDTNSRYLAPRTEQNSMAPNIGEATMCPLAGKKPLRRCNTIFVPQSPTHPQPPGAFVIEPSFIMPSFPELDHRTLPPFVAQRLFFDMHPLEQDLKRALAAHCRAKEAESARLPEVDLRKAEAARRRKKNKAFVRLLKENRHETEKAHCQAMKQERWRQAERKSMESAGNKHAAQKECVTRKSSRGGAP